MLWKAAAKASPPDVNFGWNIDSGKQVAHTLSNDSIAPQQLMDAISCSCKAKEKACGGKCSCEGTGCRAPATASAKVETNASIH